MTEDKSDVAAVSFLQTSTFIESYYSKNRPCTAYETDYIKSFLGLIRNFEPSKRDEYTQDIVNMITRICVRKVRNSEAVEEACQLWGHGFVKLQ